MSVCRGSCISGFECVGAMGGRGCGLVVLVLVLVLFEVGGFGSDGVGLKTRSEDGRGGFG